MHFLRHLARLDASDVHPGGAQASRELIAALALSDGQRLLELGCGTGRTALRLARDAHVHVVALDLLSEMLRPARRKLQGVSERSALVQADASELPFREQSFDRVYSESVLGMQSEVDLRSVLAEAFRVLKPGGLFVANEAIWKPHVEQQTVDAVNRRCEIDFGLRQASERAWSVARWVQEIRQAGFEPESWSLVATPARERRAGVAVRRHIGRLRITLAPALWGPHRMYRRRLVRHRTDGSLVEARLFVAAKPT